MQVSDRRFARRFNAELPMRVRPWKSDAPEETVLAQNISERGLYFETSSPPAIGTTLNLRLEMPEIVTGVPPAEWSCVGTVVHAQPLPRKPESMGVGVRFDFYEASSGASSQRKAFK
jgi:hypothetical protein